MVEDVEAIRDYILVEWVIEWCFFLNKLRFSVMGFFPVEKENAKMLFTRKVTSFAFSLFSGFVPR